jgi:type IV pilus assembly protein PilC
MFKYNAVTIDGTKSSGKMEAAGPPQLGILLKEQGLFLLDHKELNTAEHARKLKLIEVADFCRELGAMLSSGITLIRAMMIIADRAQTKAIKKIYDSMIRHLQRGSSLSEAMANQGKAFPELLIYMMRAGESSGRMDTSAERMAVTFTKDYKLQSKMKSATVYPAILAFMIVGVIIIVFTFVLPSFMGMFENMDLPLPTRIVMGFSGFLTKFWPYLLLGVVFIVVTMRALFTRPGPKRGWDHFKLRLPVIGKLMRTIYTARFARTLAALYVSGIPMIQALTIARNTVGNSYIEKQFDDVISMLGNGRTLSQAIGVVDGFEPKLVSTVMIGEESGKLEQMLESVADQYDYDAEMASNKLITLLEPLMIIIMAVIVAFVIISVILPIYQMYGTISEEGDM